MKLILSLLSVLLFIAVAVPVVAEELDKPTQQGLEQTVDLLNDSEKLEAVKNNDPKAKNLDKNLDSLGFNAQQKKEVYGLSAQIFEQIVKETKGDPVKMQKLLEDAMKDPEAFAKKWTPEQKAKLKGLSAEVEKSGKKVKKP
ncbi:MAG: hypothetical protein SGJ18_05380 [Pseudomonadota bacterium]|nr:hypothetical protein [Pseudomonadota bacterium]